jgi:hypothetical protein
LLAVIGPRCHGLRWRGGRGEIAVRIALGGTARSVVRLVARSVAHGAGIGPPPAAPSRSPSCAAHRRNDADPLDSGVVSVAAAFFIAVVSATVLLSASRAAAVEPAADALQTERP